jgi:SAM-dependent methyltransferase
MTDQLTGTETPEQQVTPDAIVQLGMGFWASKTLLSAIELGVFTELGGGPMDADALTARLGLHARSARDFFDSLVALDMLERTDGRYSNTPATDLFLDRGKPSYAGGMLEMSNARLYPFWANLTEGLKTGSLQNEAKDGGEGLFEALYKDPDRLKQFAQAMSGISGGAAHAISAKYPWADHQTVIDIGCAEGLVPVVLAQEHGHLTGGGFDLPPLKPIFDEFVDAAGLGDRLTFTGGDFFADPMPTADVLVMGHILHDWDLEQKKALLTKAYDALPDGGTLIVYDAIIDDDRRSNAFGLLMSLNMLIETEGGFDYTGADCRGWMADVGFRDIYVEPLVGPDSMVVGIK